MELLLFYLLVIGAFDFLGLLVALAIISYIFSLFFFPMIDFFFSVIPPITLCFIVSSVFSIFINPGGFFRTIINFFLYLLMFAICFFIFLGLYQEYGYIVLADAGKWMLGIGIAIYVMLQLWDYAKK